MRRSASSRSRSPAARSWRASAVSTTSLLVSPRWRKRPSGPTVSATWLTNAMTSWSVVCSISAIRSTSTRARASMATRALAGTRPRRTCARAHGDLDLEHPLEARLVGPERAHLGERVAADHRPAPGLAGRLRNSRGAGEHGGADRQVCGDVPPALHPGPGDGIGGPLGGGAGGRHVRAMADTASTRPPFVREAPLGRWRATVPAWNTRAPVRRLADPVDRVAAARVARVAPGRQHDRDGSARHGPAGVTRGPRAARPRRRRRGRARGPRRGVAGSPASRGRRGGR